jgi:hypothetical protein
MRSSSGTNSGTRPCASWSATVDGAVPRPDLFQRHLYDRRTGRGRILLYNPGSVTEHGKFDMVVTGRSYADIDRFVEHTIPALIGSHLGGGREGP